MNISIPVAYRMSTLTWAGISSPNLWLVVFEDQPSDKALHLPGNPVLLLHSSNYLRIFPSIKSQFVFLYLRILGKWMVLELETEGTFRVIWFNSSIFYGWGNGDPEKSWLLPKVTQVESGRARMLTQGLQFLHSFLCILSTMVSCFYPFHLAGFAGANYIQSTFPTSSYFACFNVV